MMLYKIRASASLVTPSYRRSEGDLHSKTLLIKLSIQENKVLKFGYRFEDGDMN